MTFDGLGGEGLKLAVVGVVSRSHLIWIHTWKFCEFFLIENVSLYCYFIMYLLSKVF